MQRTVNIDVTDVLGLTYTSGIQRVVREVATRLARWEGLPTRLLRFDAERHRYDVIDEADFLAFVVDHNHEPAVVDDLAIDDLGADDVFFDIDSSWNSPLKRPHLYQILKSNGVFIANVVYDMVPVLLPQLAHENTVRNWVTYIAAVYTYSDLVFAISRATERDFLELKGDFGVERHIPTVVTRLAGDLTVTDPPHEDEYELFDGFIDQRFFLFVGTLEPRKQQLLALRAWDRLRASHPDVHFVFVGREGWHCTATAEQITSHPEFGRRLHWLQRASDRVLAHLYERAFACVYLSSYEGYGLPVAEALARGKLIITSRNSSMYEVGGEAADYTFFDTPREVAAAMASYLDTDELVAARTAMIRTTFRPATWDSVSDTIGRALGRLDAVESPSPCDDLIQFVYISNDAARVVRSMRAYASHAPVKDFLVIAPEAVASDIAAEDVGAPLRVISDEELLGDDRDAFDTADHVGKNWMLRRLLPQVVAVDQVFVMLDDDSRRSRRRDDGLGPHPRAPRRRRPGRRDRRRRGQVRRPRLRPRIGASTPGRGVRCRTRPRRPRSGCPRRRSRRGTGGRQGTRRAHPGRRLRARRRRGLLPGLARIPADRSAGPVRSGSRAGRDRGRRAGRRSVRGCRRPLVKSRGDGSSR